MNKGLQIIGIRNGYQGLLDAEFMDLDNHIVSGRVRDAGTFLQTSRCLEFQSEAGQRKALDILASQKIDALIVIGGDGSLRGARALHKFGLPVIGLPGTIDNDIFGTDMGIGVDTALNTVVHLVDMIRATAASHRRCFVVEVMGRGSGLSRADGDHLHRLAGRGHPRVPHEHGQHLRRARSPLFLPP